VRSIKTVAYSRAYLQSYQIGEKERRAINYRTAHITEVFHSRKQGREKDRIRMQWSFAMPVIELKALNKGAV
jgi:hypothetical protein